jgi:hypothetical protein
MVISSLENICGEKKFTKFKTIKEGRHGGLTGFKILSIGRLMFEV